MRKMTKWQVSLSGNLKKLTVLMHGVQGGLYIWHISQRLACHTFFSCKFFCELTDHHQFFLQYSSANRMGTHIKPGPFATTRLQENKIMKYNAQLPSAAHLFISVAQSCICKNLALHQLWHSRKIELSSQSRLNQLKTSPRLLLGCLP